jgi:hypothetical protein
VLSRVGDKLVHDHSDRLYGRRGQKSVLACRRGGAKKKVGLHPTLSLGIHPFVDRSFRALQKIEEAE